MGSFWNSFEREVGKNTGKAVSNFIFGDSHSTPYRRVGGSSGGSTPVKSKRQIEAEFLESLNQQEIEHQRKMQRLQQKLAKNEHEERIANERRLEQERIDRENKQEQEKFENEKLNEIERKLKTIRNIFFFNQNDAFNYLADITTDLELLDWDLKHSTTNSKLIAINQSLCNAYFDKYCECLRLSLPLLNNIQRDFQKKNLMLFEKKNAYLNGFVSTAKLFARKIFNNTSEVQQIVELLTERRNESTYNESTQIEIDNDNSQLGRDDFIQNEINIDNTILQSENINENKYKFVDLNENKRIETRLSEIWLKYKNNIGILAERKPIFVSDSPENSILFVGVNPSYSKDDDSVLIHSQDDNSLYYQSLYGEFDAPIYFKMLDAFTKDLSENLPYSHLNLLYARENNRAKLLSCDHNFIREQLELSYDTISILKPKIIIFFTSYCKDLIFGADRWVDPISHNVNFDSYILKGLNIPVIFTEDLNTMSNIDVIKLEERVKNII
ncbi:MAG: hypothetical protein VB011_04605 [Bacteroidales bacterium]|nr:hypothetical protein [Bacteroidales bacterium]